MVKMLTLVNRNSAQFTEFVKARMYFHIVQGLFVSVTIKKNVLSFRCMNKTMIKNSFSAQKDTSVLYMGKFVILSFKSLTITAARLYV